MFSSRGRVEVSTQSDIFIGGVAYKELGDLQKAASDFTKVIELDPDNSRGFPGKAIDSKLK